MTRGLEPETVGDTIRIGKELFAQLFPLEGYLGVIEWQKGNDACLIDQHGAPIYFQREGSLKTPFSIALNIFPPSRDPVFEFNVGDRLHKRGRYIFCSADCKRVCDLLSPALVDLNHTLAPHPTAELRSAYQELLFDEISRAGSFEGLAGLLLLIPGALSHVRNQENDQRVGAWCRHALNATMLVFSGSQTRDAQMFISGCEKLIGLGPGFTPSGDDLLLGFIATHHIWSSALWQWIRDSRLNILLQAAVRRTSVLSSALLLAALQGSFAEIIYDLFESLSFHPEKAAAKADDLLRIGHTSGADLLTGIILGLMSL